MDAHELFWDIQDDCMTCPPLTESMLAEAERQLGFTLPESLVAVLKVRNGGYLRRNRFYVGTDKERFPDANAEGYMGMSTLFGICSERGINGVFNGMLWNDILREQWGYPRGSLVISHEGHGGFALYYEHTTNPEVICVYSERYPSVLVRTIAPDFETFLSRLELVKSV